MAQIFVAISLALTWWVGDDGIEDLTASPWVSRHIEGAKIYDPAGETILSRCACNAGGTFYSSSVSHGTGGSESFGRKLKTNVSLSSDDHQYRNRTLEPQSVQ